MNRVLYVTVVIILFVICSYAEENEGNDAFSSATKQDSTNLSSEVQGNETGAVPLAQEAALHLDALPLTIRAESDSFGRVKTAIQDFCLTIKELNERAAKERADLDKKTAELLADEMNKAQQAGNLTLTLAIKKVIDEAAYNRSSDIPIVSRFQGARVKRLAEIEKKLRAEGVVAARALYGKVDEQMKIATQRGQFEEAQALMEYQKEIVAWANGLSSNERQPKRGASASAKTPEKVFKMPAGRLINIKANSPFGAEIGNYLQGDIIVVQYIKGMWSNNGPRVYSPDVRPESDYGGVVIFHEEKRLIMRKLGDQPRDRASCRDGVSAIPTNTEHFPFACKVNKTGKYFLRMNDNSVLDDNSGVVTYKVIPIPSSQVKAFLASEDAGNCQWE